MTIYLRREPVSDPTAVAMLRDCGQTPAGAFPRVHTVRYYADLAATRCLAENYWPVRPTRRNDSAILNGVRHEHHRAADVPDCVSVARRDDWQ
jgi:hypothetical protein